ncbi:MAG: GDSL family lipase [Phycisphaerales bacterium]|nr:GDSL family lipase [Phycisphaerales bacterium]
MTKQCIKLVLTVCAVGLGLVGCGRPQAEWTCAQVQEQLACSENKAIQPVSRNNNTRWAQRQDAVNARVQQGNVDLLFLGDSITHGWERHEALWTKYFGQWNAVNAGFSGDQTQHLLWRIENGNIAGINPKVVVIMIGTNNAPAATAEEIAEGIAAIVCKLRTELPETKILLLAIFPRGTNEQRNAKADATYNPEWAKIDQASLLASRLADGHKIYYLDINKSFLNEEGVLTQDVMPDLLHPNAKGYELWGEAMLPTLQKLMTAQ